LLRDRTTLSAQPRNGSTKRLLLSLGLMASSFTAMGQDMCLDHLVDVEKS
jgi:hypothetical protein